MTTTLNYGTAVSGGVHDCLHQADLDYQVEMTPVRFQPIGVEDFDYVDNRYVTYRTDTKEPFGVVGSRYRIIQNNTLFEFLNYVNNFELTNAGKFKAGGWLCGKFDDKEILGEVFSPYVYFSNSHDGTTQFMISFTPYRRKTRTIIKLPNSSSEFILNVRHTVNSDIKLSMAKAFIEQAATALDNFKSTVEVLSSKHCDDATVETIFKTSLVCLSIDPKKPSKTFDLDVQTLFDLYRGWDNSKYHGTGYGVILAISQFIETVLRGRVRTEEGHIKKSVMTTNPMLKTAYHEIMKIK